MPRLKSSCGVFLQEKVELESSPRIKQVWIREAPGYYLLTTFGLRHHLLKLVMSAVIQCSAFSF